MHIVIITLGSAGDVHPFLGIGRALQARGHKITFLANDFFRAEAAAAQLDFRPLGSVEEFDLLTQNPDIWHPQRGFKILIETNWRTAIKPSVRRSSPRSPKEPIIVVASTLSLVARLVQEKTQVPMVNVHLAPANLRSTIAMPQLSKHPLPKLTPEWLKRFYWWLADKLLVDPALCPRLNQFRATLDLAPITRPFNSWNNSPDRVIGMFPDWFATVQPDWPDALRLTGFPLFDAVTPTLPPELTTFLDAGDPPLVFTPGSAMRHGSQFFRESVRLCEELGLRGCLMSRYPEQIPAILPPGVKHFSYAPFSGLLPRARALIHHGGIGSAAMAMKAKIPQLVVAMNFDQFDNGARIARLGVGAMMAARDYQALRAAPRLDAILKPTTKNHAQTIAERLQASSPLNTTCELIEALA